MQEFYESSYDGQQATDLPSMDSLRELMKVNFVGSTYDKSHRVSFVKSLVKDGQIMDFGCAWGYSMYQFQRGGYQPIGYELARNRAAFGREGLGVDIYSDFDLLTKTFKGQLDLIYADHSLEHVTNLRRPIEKFAELLKPGGLLVIFVPNGGSLYGRTLGVGWGPFLGESHTIALTGSWFQQNLPPHGFQIDMISSSPFQQECLQDNEELVCIARRVSPAPVN